MKTHENLPSGDNTVGLGGSRSFGSRSVDLSIKPVRDQSHRILDDCEERLHAVRSGLAGLAGAMHVLADGEAGVPDDLRQRLSSMVVSEVERLQRLVAASPDAAPAREALEPVDLDRVLADVVLSRRMAGQEVAWTATGHTAWGCVDDLTEVVNILVVNAWRHAGGAPTRIDVTESAGFVRIAVSDDGPGVPEELRESIFDRGVRRPYSPGQGLGLAMARELVTALGGTLELCPTASGVGACFVVMLGTSVLHGAA
jgi:signal transduction histidine kinase